MQSKPSAAPYGSVEKVDKCCEEYASHGYADLLQCLEAALREYFPSHFFFPCEADATQFVPPLFKSPGTMAAASHGSRMDFLSHIRHSRLEKIIVGVGAAVRDGAHVQLVTSTSLAD